MDVVTGFKCFIGNMCLPSHSPVDRCEKDKVILCMTWQLLTFGENIGKKKKRSQPIFTPSTFSVTSGFMWI